MANIRRINDANMLEFGLSFLGYNNQTHLKNNNCSRLPRFKAHFGVGPTTAAAIWNDLMENQEGRRELDASYFLITLIWLKGYDTDSKLACYLKVSEKTIRKYYMIYSKMIQELKTNMIVWNDEDNGTVFIGSVDGTHCRIEEPRTEPDAMWYSHKFHQPAVAYELALDLHQNRLIWVNGPFKAGLSDLHIFRTRGGLKQKIPDGKKMIADRGYIGPDAELSTPNELDYSEMKAFKRRARARQETYNARIKEFRILSDRFRHDLGKHQMVFEAVCVIVQYDVDNERPLFEV